MENLPTVALVYGEPSHNLTFEALDLIDYKKALAGFDKVVIKVNFLVDNACGSNPDTDLLMVEAVILKLKAMKIKNIYVAESDSTVINATTAFQTTGLKEICDRHGVECVDLSDSKRGVKITVPNPEKLKTISVPKLITESAIISVSTRDVLGMKNMFGLLSDKAKPKYYAKGLNAVALDINSVFKPKITLISGFVGFDKILLSKQGGVDLVIAGADVVATDATASRVLSYNPSNIDYIRKASQKGLGNLNANVVGLSIDEAVKRIKAARIQFYLSKFATLPSQTSF